MATYGTCANMKWFHFEDGSNPYGVWGNRLDEFFRMIVKYQPEMVDENTFKCGKPVTYLSVKPITDYERNKTALREFAIEWQYRVAELNLSYGELAWYEDFFRQYGKRYGLLREFHENGIC